MKTALTIAGSDPTGGAGLQADLKVFRAFNVHGLSIPSALTAQNTSGVEGILPVEKFFFVRQAEVLLRGIRPFAMKTGMLFSAWMVDVIVENIESHSLENLVVDPVTVSSSGTSLIDNGALDKIREALFPMARVVTPNIYEACVLTGINIEDEKDMERAAVALQEMGPDMVVITGGHLEKTALDLCYDGISFHRLEAPKIVGEYHGTGCVFSAAITASLAHGLKPLEAVKKAKEFVTEAIQKAYHVSEGMGILNI